METDCSRRPLGYLLNCTLCSEVSRENTDGVSYLLEIPVRAGDFSNPTTVLIAVISHSKSKFALVPLFSLDVAKKISTLRLPQ